MAIQKYKYYFRKPKSEIAKDILSGLLITGTICLAGSSPYFIRNLLKGCQKWRKYSKKKIYDAFSFLKRQNYLQIKKRGHQIYISLTEKGKKKAGWMQIDALKIQRPKRWDGKWRIVIFDIAQMKKLHREALRGKLKELKFYPLQKSIWINPFNCQAEVELLRDFFGLSEKEMRLIVASSIGHDKEWRKIFNLTS